MSNSESVISGQSSMENANPKGELQLFILWDKARFAQARILVDLAKQFEVVYTQEMELPQNAALAYRQFYGPSLPDEKVKVRKCGKGPFLLIVVRDSEPIYGDVEILGRVYNYNLKVKRAKDKYREWTHRHNRVHATLTPAEFARDIVILTGHSVEEWSKVKASSVCTIFQTPFTPSLPQGWVARIGFEPFISGELLPAEEPTLTDSKVLLENKYINDRFEVGLFEGRPCIMKRSSKAVLWSIRNEYDLAARLYARVPQVVACPYAFYFAGDGTYASVFTERIMGPSLTDLLKQGITEAQANSFAADIAQLAEALRETGILHRDLFSDNFLLGADGHLKVIDWQLGIERACYREDPWVVRHWKFHYVVFGVNRDLGLGVWNDYLALCAILEQFPQTEQVRKLSEKLRNQAPAMTFSARPTRKERWLLWGYGLSLRLQMWLRGKRHRKYAALERRWRTVRELEIKA